MKINQKIQTLVSRCITSDIGTFLSNLVLYAHIQTSMFITIDINNNLNKYTELTFEKSGQP